MSVVSGSFNFHILRLILLGMRELSKCVASASALVSVGGKLKGFFELGEVRNVTEPDVIVDLILNSKSVVVFSSLFNPSETVDLILRDVVGHQSLNL